MGSVDRPDYRSRTLWNSRLHAHQWGRKMNVVTENWLLSADPWRYNIFFNMYSVFYCRQAKRSLGTLIGILKKGRRWLWGCRTSREGFLNVYNGAMSAWVIGLWLIRFDSDRRSQRMCRLSGISDVTVVARVFWFQHSNFLAASACFAVLYGIARHH